MRYAVRQLHLVLEGGGAVALASVLSGAWDPRSLEPDSPLVVVLSGGNVAPKVLAALLT
jgi:threonine dehydratase